MSANSIAPSQRTVDMYLDGSDWKLALFEADGLTQITDGTVGSVEVAGSAVTFPLDLEALGGEPAHELRVFGSGTITILPTQPLSSAFPASVHTVVAGEVLGIQIQQILTLDAAVARVRIAWGGSA